MIGDKLKDLIILARQVEWRYKLDKFEDAALKEVLGALDLARRDVTKKLAQRDFARVFEDRILDEEFDRHAIAVLEELEDLTIGVRTRLKDNITEIATIAGSESYPVHNDILSFGGRVANFSTVALTAEQLRQMVVEVPVGGRLLADWVDSTFDTRLKQEIKKEVMAGMFLGESYPGFVKRIEQGFDLTKHDTITLVRTYVQDINVSTAEAVYQANDSIVKGLEWSAVLEPGYSKTGRGTCIRCSALDGQTFRLDEHPRPTPGKIHPRCRCIWLPEVKTWRDLGIDIDEIEEVYRPYTIRPNKNIDAGGKRTIIEQGFHDGNYASFWEKQSREFKINAVGPGRFDLIDSGKIKFSDLVDRKTGRQFTLGELMSKHGIAKPIPTPIP